MLFLSVGGGLGNFMCLNHTHTSVILFGIVAVVLFLFFDDGSLF